MTSRTWTIGQLASQFELARSTLLYYDKCGLLTPTGRTQGNYRVYSQTDADRLRRIRHYRTAGLSLAAIALALKREGDALQSALEARLIAVNREIQALRSQQQVILQLLKTETLAVEAPVVTKSMWVEMLRTAGLDEAGMHRWHAEFERLAPDAHRTFLASLGILPEEIANIRAWSLGQRARRDADLNRRRRRADRAARPSPDRR